MPPRRNVAATCVDGCRCIRYDHSGAVSSAVRASGLHPEGRVFKSLTAHHQRSYKCGAVVQPVRTPACHAGGREFEPRRPRQILQPIARRNIYRCFLIFVGVRENCGYANSSSANDFSVCQATTSVCKIQYNFRHRTCRPFGAQKEHLVRIIWGGSVPRASALG